jgi:mannose-6-phosphate isomerase
LSIQVHPNDALAKKRHNSFGKTEMWYIMQADQDARIIVGFKEDSNADEYLENLKANFTFYLGQCKCKRRRCFF